MYLRCWNSEIETGRNFDSLGPARLCKRLGAWGREEGELRLSFLMQLRSQRKVLTGRVKRDGSPTTASSVPSVLQTSHDLAES